MAAKGGGADTRLGREFSGVGEGGSDCQLPELAVGISSALVMTAIAVASPSWREEVREVILTEESRSDGRKSMEYGFSYPFLGFFVRPVMGGLYVHKCQGRHQSKPGSALASAAEIAL